MVERSADGRIRTTEWEDIQYKHGNKVGKYQTLEAEIIAQKLMDSHPNVLLKAYDPIAEKVEDKAARGGFDVDHGGNIDDVSSDDDDALAVLRKRRLQEMKTQAAKSHGALRHIAGSEYVAEITEGSSSCRGHDEAWARRLRCVASAHA